MFTSRALKCTFILWLLLTTLLNGCNAPMTKKDPSVPVKPLDKILTGAEQLEKYLPILKGKAIALVVNQTSLINGTHLVDTLLTEGIRIEKIFAPEHGFRGDADAGEKISDQKDPKTSLPIISLYGAKKEPGIADLEGVDLVVYDIQDVGVRFYTYIATLHYVMQGCAKSGTPLLVLDRPNPNGHYVDGPTLKTGFQSFVGMHPVPVVYGMTAGEYAQMINGELWLEHQMQCTLQVIPCLNYDHLMAYELPVAPSPNLKSMRAIYLYPSICFFEGTIISEGRGTPTPFEMFGHPNLSKDNVVFTPVSGPGSKFPKLEGQTCFGTSFLHIPTDSIRQWRRIRLSYLLETYAQLSKTEQHFFLSTNFIDKLAGCADLRWQITNGWNEQQIRDTWQEDLEKFKIIRKKYLLYPDFE